MSELVELRKGSIGELEGYDPSYPPIYKHDCEKCLFLFTDSLTKNCMIQAEKDNTTTETLKQMYFDFKQKAKYDLYYCNQAGYPTVVARYSNEPAEYISGIIVQHWAIQKGVAYAKNIVYQAYQNNFSKLMDWENAIRVCTELN